MTTQEYHQLLKFLYFEGYADSYEEAEYIIEEMSDEDFDSLCEEVFPQYTQEDVEILDYLISEGYADTDENALVILENMSEEWANYIMEMRKEDKVAGKKKTPLYTTKKVGRVQRAPEGSGKKWEKTTIDIKQGSPEVSSGRFRQGAQGGRDFGYRRHAHGGAADWTPAGSQRGVKKVRGEKKPDPGHITPAQRVSSRREMSRRLFGNGR